MKHVIAVVLISLSFLANAQEKKERADKLQDYTPEEMAQIQTKQMTLDLDLTDAQQKQILKINLQNAQDRKALYESKKSNSNSLERTKPSKDERLNMKNEQLDRQIEMKKKMKDILDDNQYEKWEVISKERRENQKERVHKKQKMKHSEKH
jgi:hypothetical protein